MRSQVVRDGEWIYPQMEGYLMQCCGCGLMHSLDFKVLRDGTIAMRGFVVPPDEAARLSAKFKLERERAKAIGPDLLPRSRGLSGQVEPKVPRWNFPDAGIPVRAANRPEPAAGEGSAGRAFRCPPSPDMAPWTAPCPASKSARQEAARVNSREQRFPVEPAALEPPCPALSLFLAGHPTQQGL